MISSLDEISLYKLGSFSDSNYRDALLLIYLIHLKQAFSKYMC